MAAVCADCGSTEGCEQDVGNGLYYCHSCFAEWESAAQAGLLDDKPPPGAGAGPLAASAPPAPATPVPAALPIPAPPAARPMPAAAAGSAAGLDCPICFETVKDADAMELCSHGHRFCTECCWRCCQSALSDALVPACPLDKQFKCGSVSKDAAQRALTGWLREKGETAGRKAELTLASFGVRGSVAAGFSSSKLDEVFLSRERAAQGAVQCIGRKCMQWYVPPVPHSTRPQRIQCTQPKCATSFCAACRHPYHFRSTCAEALRINARWVRFLQEEMGAFLMAATKVDPDRYGPLLKESTKQRSALDEATRDALQRFDELKKMEKWKEAHCRHCPHCHRIVEKLVGCDAMVCGSDAHGGNQQHGCGRNFTWKQAPPYHADLRSAADDGDGADLEGAEGRERRLQRDAREEHWLMAGVAVQCDGCAERIIGPRWQCVQCEGAVDLCVGCVSKATAGKASSRAHGLTLRDGRQHPKLHVFRRVRQGPMAGGPTAVVDIGMPGGAVATSTSDPGGSSRVVELTEEDASGIVPLGVAPARDPRGGMPSAAPSGGQRKRAKTVGGSGGKQRMLSEVEAEEADEEEVVDVDVVDVEAVHFEGRAHHRASGASSASSRAPAPLGQQTPWQARAGARGAMAAAAVTAPVDLTATAPGVSRGAIELSSDDDEELLPLRQRSLAHRPIHGPMGGPMASGSASGRHASHPAKKTKTDAGRGDAVVLLE